MIYKYLKILFFIPAILWVNSVSSQIEVQTVYPDGIPNSSCYLTLDTTKIGFTNRNGLVLIESKYKGELFKIEDLETGFRVNFRLYSDTIITTEKMQVFDQVDIKPINRKKLSQEILAINKSRLPEKLNLKGQFFYSELYIVNHLKNEKESDTLIETFLCDIVILDVFGNHSILINNPRKVLMGEIKDQEFFKTIEPLIIPTKNFEKSIIGSLNYDNFEIKKYRKFNSVLSNHKKNMSLKFFFSDSNNFAGISNGKEIKYFWEKSDSTLTNLSKYYQQGVESNEKFSSPFAFTEFSNRNKNYKDSYVVSEVEMRLYNESLKKRVVNGLFVYLFIDKQLEVESELKEYKSIDGMQEFVQSVKIDKSNEQIDPILFPLRFPEAIFFR